MKTLTFSTLFLPEWALPWVLVFAISAWILGARTLAVAAGLVLLAEWVLAPLLAPWLSTLPAWALVLIGAVMVLMVLQGAIDILFGERVAASVVGTYLVRLLDALMLSPFRLLQWLLRGLLGRN